MTRLPARSLNLLIALLVTVLSVTMAVHVAAQEQTPAAGCGSDVDLTEPSHPDVGSGIVRKSWQSTTTTWGSEKIHFIRGTVCMEQDITSDALPQFGSATIVLIQGSATVTLIQSCPGANCSGSDGFAEVQRASGQHVLEQLTVGGPGVVLQPGDTLYTFDSTITIASGSGGALIAASRTYADIGPGSGCPGACFQFP